MYENMDTKREIESNKTKEMSKPEFKNKPNQHIKLYYSNDVRGTEVKQEYWISRAAAVCGIIFAFGVEGGSRVLVIKRSKNMPDEPNKFGAPSGYLDWDESGYDGMVRETYEETSMYLPDYDPFILFNNNREPFWVNTNPMAFNQNISLFYVQVYDFSSNPDFFPIDIQEYTDGETAQVEWLNLQDFYNNKREWAFNHDERIAMALKHFNKNYMKP